MSPCQALDTLYAGIPQIACTGACGRQVCGPIPMTEQEYLRIRNATLTGPAARAGGHCRYLSAEDRCTVYALRPLVCRLYGVQEAFPCQHGCVPARWMTDDEAHALTVAVNSLSAHRVVRPMVLKEAR